MNNRLFLIFHGRFPGEKAASLFAAKSAEAFARAGMDVVLLVPRRVGRSRVDPYAYYSVERNFDVVYVPTLDLFVLPIPRSLAFSISFAVFSLLSLAYLLYRAGRGDIVYSNEPLPIFLSSFYFPRTLYELHDFPERKKGFYGWLFKRAQRLLITNTWKVEELGRLFNVPEDKMLYEPNAVESEKFDIPVTKEAARQRLGLPVEKKIVVYTGHLYSWKGVDTLAAAARLLPRDTLVVFVGGTAHDITHFKETGGLAENILLAGHRDHGEIPLWQKAADVVVLPNTARKKISKYYTSPMKLFEYAASKRPIVASRIPSIVELLDENRAFLVEPDNAPALARGIVSALEDAALAGCRAASAYEWVLEHTWQKRAERILRFIRQ